MIGKGPLWSDGDATDQLTSLEVEIANFGTVSRVWVVPKYAGSPLFAEVDRAWKEERSTMLRPFLQVFAGDDSLWLSFFAILPHEASENAVQLGDRMSDVEVRLSSGTELLQGDLVKSSMNTAVHLLVESTIGLPTQTPALLFETYIGDADFWSLFVHPGIATSMLERSKLVLSYSASSVPDFAFPFAFLPTELLEMLLDRIEDVCKARKVDVAFHDDLRIQQSD